MYAFLKKALQTKATIITANIFLKKYCHGIYNDQITQGNPMIVTIEEWINDLWEEYITHHLTYSSFTLLNYAQSLSLWEKLIENSSLQVIPGIEKLAYESWILYKTQSMDQHLTYNKPKSQAHLTTWKTWAATFIKHCEAHKWMDFYQWVTHLLKGTHFNEIKRSKTIFLVGFDEYTTPYNLLFKHLAQQSFSIQSICTEKIQLQSIQKLNYQNFDNEIDRMARWAWQAWDKGHTSVGCAIPQFSIRRNQIQTIFQTAYQTLFQRPTYLKCPLIMPFEKKRLVEHPLIHTAIDLLSLSSSIETSIFSRITRSAYIRDSLQEQSSRAQLDRKLHSQPSMQLSLTQLIDWSQRFQCPQLLDSLVQWQSHYSKRPADQLPSQWAKFFSTQLTHWGWPNHIDLSEEEKICLQQWSTLLAQFSTLDIITGRLSYSSALQKLIGMAKAEEYTLQTDCNATGIYLMDINEAIYFQFEKLWIVGSENTRLLPHEKPNPFIPTSLQATIQSGDQGVLKRLLHNGHSIILSHSSGHEVSSHLIEEIITETPGINVSSIMPDELQLIESPSIAHQMLKRIQWEYFQDDQAPPFVPATQELIDSNCLKKQAICPFKAFAEYRLGLIENTLAGSISHFTYPEKNRLLRQLLTTLWRQLPGQMHLKKLSDNQLTHLISAIIDQHINPLIQKKPELWKPLFIQLEKERLQKLLKNYLAMERGRPDFKVIAVEETLTYTLENLTLTLKIDRIDQLEDDTHLLIEYKTGRNFSYYANWTENKTVVAQLPLAHIASQQLAQGLSFLSIRPEAPGKFYGTSEKDINIKGIKPFTAHSYKALPYQTWNERISHWDDQLKQLANEFQTGHAATTPDKKSISCQQCSHALLCRVAHCEDTKNTPPTSSTHP